MIQEADVAQLTAMGFGENQVHEALTVCNGNVEAAINYLLNVPSDERPPSIHSSTMSADEPSTTMASAKAVGGLLTCGRSQYSLDQGRSACTCIALTAATKFLQDPNLSAEFLESMLTEGIANYHQLMRQSSSSASSIEHLSAEEVLQQPNAHSMFPLQILPGGIRQGLLSNDFYHPMGLKALLEGIRSEQPLDQWMAILITKTPETVLLCFPPPTGRSGGTTTAAAATTATAITTSAFWLIDSHPRPQLGVESAYAKLHPTLDALWMSLQAIFPCTELGPDIPEMMAMMYNSFDLYPLLLLRST